MVVSVESIVVLTKPICDRIIATSFQQLGVNQMQKFSADIVVSDYNYVRVIIEARDYWDAKRILESQYAGFEYRFFGTYSG